MKSWEFYDCIKYKDFGDWIIKTEVYVAGLCNLILLFFTTSKFNHKPRIVTSKFKGQILEETRLFRLKQF